MPDTISVKKHFTRLLLEHDRRIKQAQEAAQRAVEKAETAIDKRLDLLNEFRSQVSDESAKYVNVDQWENIRSQIKNLEKSRDRAYGGIFIVALIGIANLVKLFWVD